MPWLFLLLLAAAGFHQADALAAHLAPSAAELRWAIGGLLLGLPIALAISAFEHRAASLRSRFSRY
ncbi:MAG: hypothetical protein ACQGVC_14400 [Myxococcota bacterium]